MDLTVRTETYVLDDRSWLDSEHGTDATVSVTLDVALFTLATHYPDEFIKSGCVLGIVTATGLYGPYTPAAVNGLETAVGHLFDQVRVKNAPAKVGGAMLRHGFVKRNKVPYSGVAGGIDAAAEADVKGFIGYRTA